MKNTKGFDTAPLRGDVDGLLHSMRAGLSPPAGPNGSTAIPSRKLLQSGAMKRWPGLVAISRFLNDMEAVSKVGHVGDVEQREHPSVVSRLGATAEAESGHHCLGLRQ